MPQNTPIIIPPAEEVTIYPSWITFVFEVESTCMVCFGTANPPGSFGTMENQTWEWYAGSTHPYPVPTTVGATLPYNTSDVGKQCSPTGIADNGKVIHVGSGFQKPNKKAAKKAQKKATKTSATLRSKAKSSSKSRPKAKPKRSAKKAATKSKPGTRTKTKTKTKTKAKKGKKSKR